MQLTLIPIPLGHSNSGIMDKWHGKVAVITGASAGIGASIAVALAKAGLQVIGLARRADAIEVSFGVYGE